MRAVPDDSVVIAGTAACEFSEDGVSADGEPGSFLVTCELDMSAPRVSGIERGDRFRFFPTGSWGTV
ncbi:MAG: hypothetical protein U9N79_09855 [Actinomycetota bacterium]|nr:hypothetical protein [Actinomycetota bacterium]